MGNAAQAAAPVKTLIDDVIYRADGTPASGTLLISWLPFITAEGKAVAAGKSSVKIGPDGAVKIQLAPNAGATPAGGYYVVEMVLDDGTSSTEYWTVPAVSSATVAAVRAKLKPANVAVQEVTKTYIDALLAGKASDSTVLHLTGEETVDGKKRFAAGLALGTDPVTDSDAATKQYVDVQLAARPGGLGTDASQASGATPEQKIVNAGNATTQRVVSIPSTLGGGYDVNTPIKSKVLVLDWRGCSFNVWSSDCTNGWANSGGALLRMRVAEPVTEPNRDTYQTFQVHLDAESGGVNSYTGGVYHKSNWNAFVASLRSSTPGQQFGISGNVICGSNGDCFGGSFVVTQYGNTNLPKGGDEGLKALSASGYQGSEEFAATVSSIVGNVINYNSPTAEYSRGEKRYLLVTNRDAYSTGTVSISGNSVTGSGTGWNTLCPGNTAPCSVSNRFFSLDGGNTAGPQLYVVRVKSVDSATRLTLTWEDDGSGDEQGVWPGDGSSGSYKIFPGSTVTAVAKAGNVTVVDGSQFHAGDSVKMPIGNFLGLAAGAFQVAKYLPGGWSSPAVLVNNVGPRALSNGVQIQGKFGTAIGVYPQGGSILGSQGNINSVITTWGTAENASIDIFRMNRNATPIYGAATGDFTVNFDKRWDTITFSPAYYTFKGTTAGVQFDVSDINSVPRFGVRNGNSFINNGSTLYFFADNQATTKAQIWGSSGEADFTSVKLLTQPNPTCDAGHRGLINYVAGGPGVKDSVQVCAKDAGDAYAWRTIY